MSYTPFFSALFLDKLLQGKTNILKFRKKLKRGFSSRAGVSPVPCRKRLSHAIPHRSNETVTDICLIRNFIYSFLNIYVAFPKYFLTFVPVIRQQL